VSVEKFLDTISDEQRRKDAYKIVDMMKKVTKEKPKMWGTGIIGFGSYHYKYESGHEGETCKLGFSPRKDKFSLYLSLGLVQESGLMSKLGKHKAGKGCLYINKLADVDESVLKELMKESLVQINKKYVK
jgi:hypothetical protein